MNNETQSKAASATASAAALATEEFSLDLENAPARSYRHSYHELADRGHVVETDALEQLKMNIAQLEDLHGRLKYMMAEVSGLIKK